MSDYKLSDYPQDQLVLLIAVLCIGAIVILADLIIFVRWLHHRYRVHALEEQYLDALTRYQPVPDSERATDSLLSTAPVAPHPADVFAAARAQIRPPFASTWSLIDPFIGFQLVFGVSQVVITAALLPLILHDLAGAKEVIFTAPGILIQALGLIFMNALFAGIVVFYLKRYGASLKSIGLGRPSPRMILLGLGLGLALFAGAGAAEAGLGAVLPHLLPKSTLDMLMRLTKETTAGGLFAKINSTPIKILFALAGAVAAPIGEELFFRGFLYNALKRRFNVGAAIVISGLIFALVHFGPIAVLVIFPMGMLLAYVYERTRSLWVTITIHAVNNGLSFILMFAFPHLGESPAQKPVPTVPPSGKPAVHRSVSPQSDAPRNRKRIPRTGDPE